MTDKRALDVLEVVYGLCALRRWDDAADRLVDFIDTCLYDDDIGLLDQLLAAVDLSRLDRELYRTLLSFTIPAKSGLPSRKALFDRIEAAFVEQRGPARTERLLRGLA